jgi:pimeloyl-ACP methyl ester carboxylesterase
VSPSSPWRRRLRRVLKVFVALHVVALIGGAFVLLHGQRVLMYHPLPGGERTPDDLGIPHEALTLQTSDGEQLRAWFVPTESPRGAILYCYGNAGNLSHRLRILEMLRGLDVDLLFFDYRGFGTSSGSPTEAGTYRDAQAAWAHLVQDRGVDPSRIVVYGRSMGGPIASWLAARERPAGLVVDSSFESLPRLVQDTYPSFMYVPSLLDYSYDTVDHVSRVRAPVLVAHSPTDSVVPVAHGRAIAAAAGDATWLELQGGHGDAPFVSGSIYLDGLDAFLDRVLGEG